MSAAFTPGPWVAQPLEFGSSYVRIRGGQLGRRFKIANVLTPVYDDDDRTSREVLGAEQAETLANARLIAASPGLLTTLTQLCFVIRTGGDVLKACEGAEAQIAKVMGTNHG